MDDIWYSKGSDLVLDHLIQLLLQLWGCLGALCKSDISVNALPLDLMIHPALHSQHLRKWHNAAALHSGRSKAGSFGMSIFPQAWYLTSDVINIGKCSRFVSSLSSLFIVFAKSLFLVCAKLIRTHNLHIHVVQHLPVPIVAITGQMQYAFWECDTRM